jgi:two-component system cell cycle sensor histidine kinase/response regulator CckA
MEQPTILLIQEEEPTRTVLAQFLVQEGFLVLTAATGHDALGVLRASLTPIDVLVLNLPLPDLEGQDLCAHLRRLHPNRLLIICTGEAEANEEAKLFQLGVKRFFRKPVDLDDLLSGVRQALDSRSSSPIGAELDPSPATGK